MANRSSTDSFTLASTSAYVSTSASASGAVFLDLIFATLPIILIVVYTLTHAAYLSDNRIRNLEEEVTFHKLVSVSDIIVKQLAVQKSGGGWDSKFEPNLIDESELSSINPSAVAESIGLKSIYIGFEPHGAQSVQSGTKKQNSICVYRIVVSGEFREIRKLFICGD